MKIIRRIPYDNLKTNYLHMNKIIFLAFLFLNLISFSQEKVTWTTGYNPKKQSVEITATIAEGWHLYSQHISNEIGPVPTAFKFIENPNVTLKGVVLEPTPIQEYDENFEATLDFFKEKAMFHQEIIAKNSTDLEVIITYMVCNDVMCLPPVDQKFVVQIKPN